MNDLPRLNIFQQQFNTNPLKMYELSEWLEDNSYYSTLHISFVGNDADKQREQSRRNHEEFKKKFDEYMKIFNDTVKAQSKHLQKQAEQDREQRNNKNDFMKEVSIIADAEIDRIINQASPALKNSIFFAAWVEHLKRTIPPTLHLPL